MEPDWCPHPRLVLGVGTSQVPCISYGLKNHSPSPMDSSSHLEMCVLCVQLSSVEKHWQPGCTFEFFPEIIKGTPLITRTGFLNIKDSSPSEKCPAHSTVRWLQPDFADSSLYRGPAPAVSKGVQEPDPRGPSSRIWHTSHLAALPPVVAQM